MSNLQKYIRVDFFVGSKGIVDISSSQVYADVGDPQNGLLDVYQAVYQATHTLQ